MDKTAVRTVIHLLKLIVNLLAMIAYAHVELATAHGAINPDVRRNFMNNITAVENQADQVVKSSDANLSAN